MQRRGALGDHLAGHRRARGPAQERWGLLLDRNVSSRDRVRGNPVFFPRIPGFTETVSWQQGRTDNLGLRAKTVPLTRE